MNTNAGALEELDREECLQLLASFSVGRIAVATTHTCAIRRAGELRARR